MILTTMGRRETMKNKIMQKTEVENGASQREPRVIFTSYAWEKINAYIHGVDGEISGLGRATLEGSDVVVSDVFIWKQTCTGASSEVEGNAHSENEAMVELIRELVIAKIPVSELCVLWHSHHTMQAFFSSTDVQTLDEWVTDRFIVAVVGNVAGDFKAMIRVPAKTAFGSRDVVFKDVAVNFQRTSNTELEEEIERNIKEKVSFPKPKQIGFHDRFPRQKLLGYNDD